MMRIITRAEWGARPPRAPMTRVPWADRLGTCIHHTEGNRDDTPAELQAYAQDSLGYIDGHYNLLVDYLGNAYEGRGAEFSAAHSEGENRTHVGIAFIGKDADVTPAAETTIAGLVAEINRQAGRVLPELKGHQEMPGAQTSCPGPRLMGLVNRLREGDDDMLTEDQERQLDNADKAIWFGGTSMGAPVADGVRVSPPDGYGNAMVDQLAELRAASKRTEEKVEALELGGVDATAIAEALAPLLRAAVRDELDNTRLTARLAS